MTDFSLNAESSSTIAILKEAYPNDSNKQRSEYARLTDQLQPVRNKIESDSMNGGRLWSQIQMFRFCRLFDFEFVANQNIEALRLEIETYSGAFPFTNAADLLTTLEDYKNHASRHLTALKRNLGLNERELHLTTEDMWSFWRKFYLQLPLWYATAAEVAIVLTSSAAVERVFSLYAAFFGDSDRGCLADRREASVKLRHNENKRKAEAS